MSRTCLSFVLLLVMGVPAATGAEGKGRGDPEALARRLWAITEVVLENHIDPPARQEMLLSAAKALARASGQTAPAGISRPVSRVVTEKDWVALVKKRWPRSARTAGPAALEALLRSVPGRASLLPPQGREQFAVTSANRYVGTGIQIKLDPKRKLTQIVVPLRRGPARRAGARPNDLIVRINGKSAKGLSIQKVVELIRGEEGTPVTLDVRQPGSQQLRTLKMIRSVVPFENVLGYRRRSEEEWNYRVARDAPIAYVWVKSVTASTLHELRQVERKLKAQGVRALVLDLRFCFTSGSVQQAALLADGLLDGGVLWRLRDAHGKVKEYPADRECLFRGWPLAVLVNGAVADMVPQMVAAALQDNRRAVLVGEKTRGEGFANRMVTVPGSKEVLVLRTKAIERAGKKPRGWGVVPDHLIPMTKEQRKALEKWLVQKDLPELPPGTTDAPPADPQLAKAVKLLRAALEKSKKTK
jgi:carboxyl-terminal processing protease